MMNNSVISCFGLVWQDIIPSKTKMRRAICQKSNTSPNVFFFTSHSRKLSGRTLKNIRQKLKHDLLFWGHEIANQKFVWISNQGLISYKLSKRIYQFNKYGYTKCWTHHHFYLHLHELHHDDDHDRHHHHHHHHHHHPRFYYFSHVVPHDLNIPC